MLKKRSYESNLDTMNAFTVVIAHWFLFQDKKSLESVCLAFARLVDNIQNEKVNSLNFIFTTVE